MRFHRFYIASGDLEDHYKDDQLFEINDAELIHQLRTVFRFKSGHEIILFDGNGFDYLCSIEEKSHSHRAEKLRVRMKQKIELTARPKRKIVLFQSLIKKDNFEFIAEKATELGVSTIIPVMSERSEKKDLNLDRIEKIVTEAAEQSGRGTLPAIGRIVSLQDALKQTQDLKVAFHPEGKPFHIYIESGKKFEGEIGVYIGPEGGWSESEIKLFQENSVDILSLGPATLRAPTAAIAALALLLI